MKGQLSGFVLIFVFAVSSALGSGAALSPKSMPEASIALQYFSYGKGINPTSRLPRGWIGGDWFNFWDFGMAIDGTVAAYEAGLVSQTDYQSRIDALLSFLENMQLNSDNAPFCAYKWDTGVPAWSGGMDAADTGRTFNALGFLRRTDPSYASRIDNMLTGRLKPWIDKLASYTFSSGFDVYRRDAFLGLTYFRYLNNQYDKTDWLNGFYAAWTSTNRINDAYGNSMPLLGANLGPVSYELLESGEDYGRTVQYASDMKQWAQNRNKATGKSGVWGSELHVKLSDGSTPFAWELYVVNIPNVGYATWRVNVLNGPSLSENDPGLGSTVSSIDAAYALHAVFPSDAWVGSMFPRFTQSDLTTASGYYESLFEVTNSAETTISLPHNAVVLLASVYQTDSQLSVSSRTTDGLSNVGSITISGKTQALPTTLSLLGTPTLDIQATPPPDYQFYYWDTSGGVSVANCFSASTSATTSQDGTLSAVFTPSSNPSLSRNFFHPSTEFWFSRYDMKNAGWDAIHVLNVAAVNATVQITIGTGFTDSFTLEPEGTKYRTYPGYVGGPVHVTSDQPIWATQRVLGWTAVQEIYGMPGDMSGTDIMFTWYDLVSASSDDIYVINPSTSQTANVTLYVAGAFRGRISVSPRSVQVANFPGVKGGPFRIISSIPIFASQRVIGYSDFAEVIGLPSWYTFTETWFNWYDMETASWDAIQMVNPGGTQANVQICVAGTLRASLILAAGAGDYRTFPGLMGGPVRVVSDQPIWVTQRIIGWGGWKEVFGVPTALANTQWYMTWYDMQGASWDAIHVLNPSSSNATVSVYVGGVLKSTVTVQPGQAVYVTYPGLAAGPIRVTSDIPIIASQRILGWSSFEETISASI